MSGEEGEERVVRRGTMRVVRKGRSEWGGERGVSGEEGEEVSGEEGEE